MPMRVPFNPDVAPAGGIPAYEQNPATPGGFGGQLAGAMERGGAEIERGADSLFQAAQLRQGLLNETVVNDADSVHYAEPARDIFNEYQRLQGKDAVDKFPEYQQKLHDLRDQVRDSLGNPQQQRMFDAVSRRRMELTLNGMAEHANRQYLVYDAQASQSVVNTSLNDAANSGADERQFGAALGHGIAEIHRSGVRWGQADDTINARVDAFLSDAWSNRIRSAVLRDPLTAQALYDANQDSIEAKDRPLLEHQIKQAVMPVQAKNDAMGIIAADAPKNGATLTATQTRAHLGSWMSQAEAVAAKKYPDDPIYRDLVVSQIATYANRIATAEDALQRNARNSMMAFAMMPDANGDRPSDLNKLLATPAARDAWSRMEPNEQMGILNILDRNGRGIDPPATLDALNKYHEMRGLAVNDPSAFQQAMKDHFYDLGQVLPKSLFLQLINQDTMIDKGTAKEATLSMKLSRIHTATDGLLQQAGFVLPKKEERNQDRLDAYQNWTSRMLEASQQFIDTNKRQPTDAELRDLGKQLLVTGYTAGTGHTWFGYTWGLQKRKAFQVEPGNFAVPAPPEEAKKITDSFVKTFNRQPTQQEIDQWYAAKLQQQHPTAKAHPTDGKEDQAAFNARGRQTTPEPDWMDKTLDALESFQ